MQQVTAHLVFDWANASFEQAEAEVRQWGDGQGTAMDDLIVPVVVGLNLLGIRTLQSCEGHLDYGFAYPWVMFERPVCPCYLAEWQACQNSSNANELDAYHASDRLLEAMDECPHRPAEALRLAGFLAAFAVACPPSQVFLTIDYAGATFYRLIPIVAQTLQGEKAATLALCQAEMMRFAAFLREQHEASRV